MSIPQKEAQSFENLFWCFLLLTESLLTGTGQAPGRQKSSRACIQLWAQRLTKSPTHKVSILCNVQFDFLCSVFYCFTYYSLKKGFRTVPLTWWSFLHFRIQLLEFSPSRPVRFDIHSRIFFIHSSIFSETTGIPKTYQSDSLLLPLGLLVAPLGTTWSR